MRARNRGGRRFLTLAALTAAVLLACVLAPNLAPNDPYATNAAASCQPPSARYPLGTDELGRCVMSRVLAGARTSVVSSAALVAILFTVGTALGAAAGYLGGRVDAFVVALTDFFLAFPQMVLAVAVAGILGGGLANAMLALGLTGWSGYARLARSRVMAVRQEPYIEAARMADNTETRIFFRYVLPNVLGPLAVNGAMQVGVTMLDLAGLSFLGLGAQVPKAEWGAMINQSRSLLQLAPWTVLAPGAAIFLTVSVFNLLGDGIRDAMDPSGRSKGHGKPSET